VCVLVLSWEGGGGSGDEGVRELKTKLGTASGVVLERASCSMKSEFLLPLIQANLRHSHAPLDTILNLATNVFPEVPPEAGKKDIVCVEGYPTLSRTTFAYAPPPHPPYPPPSPAPSTMLFSLVVPSSPDETLVFQALLRRAWRRLGVLVVAKALP
jgi:hypothetical protein